jgi:hypothetical protein
MDFGKSRLNKKEKFSGGRGKNLVLLLEAGFEPAPEDS